MGRMSVTSGRQRVGKCYFVSFILRSLRKEGKQLELHLSKHLLGSESFKLDIGVMFTSLYELITGQSKNAMIPWQCPSSFLKDSS